ncbi:MAG TPA: beta-ketoacyl-ACP synthase II [Candidatus Manganitrophaceae bacterium]|nr:beta-ketoacyl-ACP synthase II [Candidatus Manganitrophaceae bacterium]
MTDQRIVITGLGVVSSIGLGKESFWRSLIDGKSGLGKIQGFDASAYSSRIAGEISDFKPEVYIPRSDIPKMSKVTQYGFAAARMAVEDAGLQLSEEEQSRTGIAIGTGLGGMGVYEEQLRVLIATGNPRRVHPWSVPLATSNATAAQIAISLGLKGPNITISTACSSGAQAIGYGVDLIRLGRADRVIAGGTEACILPGVLAAFCSLRALSVRNDEPSRASRPFDKRRDGFVMGEGAAIVILETLESAKRRGAPIYVEMAGYGSSCEATHMVSPEQTGRQQAHVMELALKEAGISPSEVDYINTHGTSTLLNDLVETRAIKMLFKEHAYRISMNSTKSMIGHTIGAAGAIEAVVCALTLQRGIIHPTLNYEEPDPECDLDYTPNKARERKVRVALSNSFGFGSNNACLILKDFS